MFKSRWFLVGSLAVAGVVAMVLVWRESGKSARSELGEGSVSGATTASTTGSAAMVSQPLADTTPVGRFSEWTKGYLAADAASRMALVKEGETLARARLELIRELIKHDPKEAIRQAVPYALRKQLPESFKPLLEESISGSGALTVKLFCALPGHEGKEPPPQRQVKIDGREFDAYVYDWRSQLMSKKGIAIQGIAVGSDFAMSADGARALDAAEAADVIASGRAALDTVCSICGKSTGTESLMDLGTGAYRTTCAAHATTLNESIRAGMTSYLTQEAAAHSLAERTPSMTYARMQQIQAYVQSKQAYKLAYGSVIGSTNPPPPPPGHLGQRSLLIIPAQFGDESGAPITQQAAENGGQNVSTFYNRASYGFEQMLHTVTPTVVLPYREAVYDEQGDGTIIGDAEAIAAAMGYDVFSYDFIYVITTSFPSATFGGISSGLSFGTGPLNHEIGHNNGLGHANYFDNSVPPTTGLAALPIDPDGQVGHYDINGPFLNTVASSVQGTTAGSIIEYGDNFDTMGGGGSDFSASMKNSLGWLPNQFVRTIPGSETNRLYAFDSGSVTNGRTYALRVNRRTINSTANAGPFWISHRRALGAEYFLQNGVLLQHGTSATLLLDTTPQTPDGRHDSVIVVGRTFTDPEAQVHITPTAVGGSGVDAFIDVVVQRGPFPGNQTPAISSLTADDADVPVGTTVNFSVAASDADGDLLAYHFDFGDQTFSTNNAPSAAHTFTAAGIYNVRCEVSDTKGGLASGYVIVNVGSPSTFTISGRVVDTDGLPVQGVRVHNGVVLGSDAGNPPVNPGNYRFAYTDSDGNYTIPNVAPGTYTVGAFIYRYRSTPLNFNGVVTVNSADISDVQFLSAPLPKVSATVLNDAPEGGMGTFRVTRTGPPTNDLLVKIGFSTPDSASFSTSTNNNVLIPTGSSFADIDINAANNGVGDGGRHAVLTVQLQTNYFVQHTFLSNGIFVTTISNNLSPGWEVLNRPSDGASTWYQTLPNYVIGIAEASMLIVDDDATGTPTVSVSAANTGVVEGSRDVGTFTVTRAGAPLTNDLVVNLAFSGSATNGVDYLPVPGTVTIPAGERFAFVPVVPINNYFVESNRTVRVNVLPGTGYNNSASTASLTIVDDDLPSISVYANDPVAAHPSGNTGQVTITRSGDLTRDVLVNYLASGTAIAGSDYNTLSGSVLIPAGSLSATVTVTPTAAASSPGSKTVVLVVSDSPAYNVINRGRATVTVYDAVPTVTVANSGNAAENGGTGSFTITRTGATTNALTVYFAVGGSANPNTDYSGIGTNVVVPIGSASVNIPIVPLNDSFREFTAAGQNNARLNEHEDVQITLLPRDTYLVGGNGTASVTITDDDGGLFPSISFLTTGTVVREDAGSVSIPVRIGGNPTNSSVVPVIVNWAITGGTAVDGTNFDSFGQSPGTLSFFSNRVATTGPYRFTQQIQFLDFDIYDDGVRTGDKTIILTLSYYTAYLTNGSPTNFIPYPTNFVLGDYKTHTITIQDADSAVVSVQALQSLAYEAGPQPATFRFTRTGVTNTSLTVGVSYGGTAAYGADYAALPASVTFAPGVTTVDVPVVPFDDAAQEQAETVVATLLETPGVQFGQDTATIIVVDNDGTIQFAFASFSVNEAATNVVLDVLRTGATNLASTVDYFFADGTATNGVDFLGTNGTIAFAAGETVKQITVPIVDNLLVQPTRGFTVALTNATGGAPLGGQRSATVNILDDDVSFVFSSPAYSVYENATNAQITVLRLGVSNTAVSVDFATFDGTALNGVDYADVTNTITFAPGETNKTLLIAISNDVIFEGDETVNLTLANPSPGTTVGAISNAVLTILDDETSVEFASASYSVLEYAGFVSLQISRVGGTEHPLTVSFKVVNGTAINGSDFMQLPSTIQFAGDSFVTLTNGSGQVRFVPGESFRTINVPILDDTLGEGNETFQVVLTGVTGPGGLLAGTIGLGAQTNATVTIIDDEQPGFVDYAYAPVVGVGSVVGGGGPTTVVDGVVRNALNGQGLPGVAITVEGSSTISGTGGAFTITNAPVGTVELDAVLPGFTPFTNIYNLLNQPTNVVQFAMSPSISGASTIRMVLTWGQNPADLDSHLDTPVIAGQAYHVYFGFRGDLVNPPFAALDVDDVNGFGPETMTITNAFPGTYSYYVHRFSGLGTLAGSGAQVQVYTDAGLINTITAPTSGTGDYWHVLQIDGASLGVSIINTIGSNPPVVITNLAPSIVTQPQSQVVDVGSSVLLSVVASGSTPLSYQWRKAAGILPGQTNATLFLPNVSTADAGNYSVVVSNLLGSVTSSNATLTVSVACGTGINGGFVYALGLDTNQDKLVLGGAFTTVNGLSFRRIARLTPGGQADASFNPGTGANSNVFALAVQPDGRVLLGGDFTNVDGATRVRVARLGADGNLDVLFNPGPGANATVRAVAVQPDGKVLVGGDFTSFAGSSNYAYLARLNTNGALDTNFIAQLDRPVLAIAVQTNGAVLVGGCFTAAGGTARNHIARLDASGTNDVTFNPGFGTDGAVRAIAVQADGRILIGGAFGDYSGTPVGNVTRLNANGSIDTSFLAGTGADAAVNAIAVTSLGKIYAAGAFNMFNGQARRGFTRLTSDGAVDLVFDPGTGADGPVYAAVAQQDAALFIGGAFTQVNGLARTGIARIHGDEKSVVTEIQLTSASYSVVENAGPAVVTVLRNGNTNQPLSVNLITSDGTATNVTDYTGGLYPVNFAVGELSTTVNIPIANNGTVEGNRFFHVALTNVPASTLFTGPSNAIVTIEDDEQLVRLGAASYFVTEGGTVAITVQRIGTTNAPASVTLMTTNGNATPGSDYTPLTTTVSFGLGESSKTFFITAFEDQTHESPETVDIVLLNPTGATLGTPASATLTISDFIPLPGGVDIGFDPGQGADDLVRALALQPDGRIVIGGAFSNYNGTARVHLARLNTNGTLDATFDPGAGPDAIVSALAVLGDGRIYVGGGFLNVNSNGFNRLVRVLTNGQPDFLFNGPGTLDSAISGLAAFADGRVLGVGAFSAPRRGAIRLNANGTFDLSFTNFAGAYGSVNAVAVDADGRAYLGGNFTNIGGVAASRLARVLPDGTVDTNFVAAAITNGVVYAVVAQPDGRVVVGGEFTSVGGAGRNRVARLNNDGTLDPTFDPGAGASGTVFSLALQGNGRLIAGGAFTNFGGVTAGRFARVETNGVVDPTFNPGGVGADGPVYALAVTPDGRLAVGGDFHSVNGVSRRGVALLYGLDTPLVRFYGRTPVPSGFQVTVNTVPGAAYAIEASEDLVAWTSLGTLVALGTTLTVTDTNAPAYPVRVYRARLVTP